MMLSLKVLNPKGEVFISNEVLSVTLPSLEGVITVYPNHKPIISLLGVGEVTIDLANNTDESILIYSGVIRVDRDSVVTILADTAELSSEIDVDSAILAKKSAEEYLKNNADIPDSELAMIQVGIERETLRIEVGKLRQKRGSSIKVNVEKED